MLLETLASLDLLFPPLDPEVVEFLKNSGALTVLDGAYGRSRPTNLREFVHWRDRLKQIHEAFNEPPPGWSQLWADKRNLQQFYTFWIALLILVSTLVFGLITSVTGIIQCYASMESLKLAREDAKRGIART